MRAARVLQAMGIEDYSRFICGYHIRSEQKAEMYKEDPGRYCALDWYSQSAMQRRCCPSVWDHFLLVDTVDPFKWYEAKSYTSQGQFDGWQKFEVGAEGW